MRLLGKSYSEIKAELGISKSTLSGWLNDMPLSLEQLRDLRDLNPRRIEHFRETMRTKRDSRLNEVYKRVANDIGRLSRRDLFVAGLYLYWGEGTKSARGKVSVANTDPAVVRTFMNWLTLMEIPKTKLKVRLHLYKDMSPAKEIHFWAKELGLSRSQFIPPYVKESNLKDITYKNGFGHGTCNIQFENIAMWEYISMALRYLREQHVRL